MVYFDFFKWNFVNATRHFVDKSINTLVPKNHQLSGYFNLNLSNVTHEGENILRVCF